MLSKYTIYKQYVLCFIANFSIIAIGAERENIRVKITPSNPIQVQQIPVSNIVINKDWIVTAGKPSINNPKVHDTSVKVINRNTKKIVHEFILPSEITALALENNTLAVAIYTKDTPDSIFLYNLSNGKQLAKYNMNMPIQPKIKHLKLAGNTLYGLSTNNFIYIWDTIRKKQLPAIELKKRTAIADQLFELANNKIVYSRDDNTTIAIKDLADENHKPIIIGLDNTNTGQKIPIRNIAINGNTLITNLEDNTVISWDLNTGKEISRITLSTPTRDLLIADSHYYYGNGRKDTWLSLSMVATILIFDKTGKLIQEVNTNKKGDITALAIDGNTLVTGFEDGTIIIWNLVFYS